MTVRGVPAPDSPVAAMFLGMPASHSLALLVALLVLAMAGMAIGGHRRREREQREHLRALREREQRLRLSLWASNEIYWQYDLEKRELERTRVEPDRSDDLAVQVAIVPREVPAADFRLRHKTSDRGFYDRARAAAGTFELLFHDEDGFLTEGSFTNLFVMRDGRLVTPPLARGLLPGVLRERLIASGEASEADLVPADLADGFFVGNALRGLIRARLAKGVSQGSGSSA